MAKDYLSNKDFDLIIKNGDFAKGESDDQEVGRVLLLNQGMLTSDPLLGPNLIQLMRDRARPEEFSRQAKLHLERDGKDYNQVKDKIKLAGYENN